MIFYFILSSLQFRQVYNQYSLLTKDFDKQTFIDTSGWNHVGSALDISTCTTPYNTMSIYGVNNFHWGATIFKTFDVPPHYSIQISFQFWIVDYQQNYFFKIYTEDQAIGFIREADLTFTQNLCGDNFYDSYATFTFRAPHVGSQATIIITSTLDQQITSWGIRDFIFSFIPCPVQCIQCQDSTSICNLWQFQQEFWTTKQIINSEGWNYWIGSFSTFNCIGQNFIQIQQLGDILSSNVILKPYYMFRIQFYLIQASILLGEQIIISINTQFQYQDTFNYLSYPTQCSGINDGDKLINFQKDLQYSQFNTNNLLIQISSDIQSTSRFFGLRNFYIFIAPCISNCLQCTTNNDCQLCDIDYYFDGAQCQTIVASSSIYILYKSQQNINLNKFTQSAKTQCNSLQIYGGYQQSNTMQFNITEMPFHNQLRIKINIIAIDKWQFYNTLQLFLDGQQYNIINRDKYDSNNRQNLCGSDIWTDNQYFIDILQNHYSSFLFVKLSFFDQSTIQYFGVLDISIDYYYCGPTCVTVTNFIKSYGSFDQSLKQIIIIFDVDFVVLGLESQQALKEENCVIIKNSYGRCLIENQKIYYQFDSSLYYRLEDIIEIEKEYFNFMGLESFEILPIQLKLDPSLNYYPLFNLNYPFKILQCKKYLIYIEEIINVGYYDYLIEIINDDSIVYSIQNKTILFKAKIKGQIQFGIKITNFVKQFQIKMIDVLVVNDYNLEFEVLPQIGQVNRQFDFYINIENIKRQNCINTIKNFTKMIEISFNNLNIIKQLTNQQEYKSNINLAMLNLGQTYQINITLSYQELTNTYLKNYSITQIKPIFSIIGGNRMIYSNNRLNVSAIIVDPDNLGLICQWQCLNLETNQDCGFNFTSKKYQLMERYQLDLYKTYQFIYNCQGNKVYANYYITDINEDQLFMFFPIIYSSYQQNQLIPLQYFIFNESNKNQLIPIQNKNIGIRIIQNQIIIDQSYQQNSFGFQFLSNIQGNVIIQSQLNQMVSSINISLYKSEQINTISVNILQGIALQDKFKFSLINYNHPNPPYLFQYLVKVNDQITYHLSKWSQYSEQSFILPQGIQSNNHSLEIILQIMDGFGYIWNQSQFVIVKQISEEISKIDLFLQLFNNNSTYDDYFITLGYELLQIQEDGCLTNCSNNGICKANKCICDNKFYLNDCSANQSQFQNIINQTNQLIQYLLQQDEANYINNNLIYYLLQNQFIQNNLEFQLIEQIINLTCQQIQKLTNIQNIQDSDIDIFIRKFPQNNQILINYDNQQNLNSLLNILDLSFGLMGFDSPQAIENRTLQNNYNMKLVNASKNLSLFMGLQQYIDQESYKFDGKYINIISQKVSSNYSQIYFTDPLFIRDQINQSLYELQNESIISTVIYKTNPYLADKAFPYQSTNTQAASVQVYDSNGLQYRSFIPMQIRLTRNNSNQNNTVCIGQIRDSWINNICQTIKLTNQIICSCDSVNQVSIVEDVDNLYSNSNLRLLAKITNFMKIDFLKSYITYILILFTICSLIFSFIGYKKDQIDIILFNRQKQFGGVIKQLEYDSEEEDTIKNYDSVRFRKRKLSLEIFIGLKKLHSFLRIYNEFLIDQPRPARYKIYFLKQCILLSMTIIFGKGFSIIQNITLSLISIILITPLEKIIIVGFAFNASMKLKITIQGFIMIVYSSCWYICTTIAATVGAQKSNDWALIFIISFLINNLVVEAISIILKITFSPFIDSFINEGNCLIRFIYFYLYDPKALTIIREINHYEQPQLTV